MKKVIVIPARLESKRFPRKVLIDLNGKTLSQHPMHYLQQRFFTCISLGSAPFITGQGPGNFGPFVPCRNVLIKNGFIGRSSHHSIHGNGMTNVVLENLVLYNFEVAGLSLNGGENLLFRNADGVTTKSNCLQISAAG